MPEGDRAAIAAASAQAARGPATMSDIGIQRVVIEGERPGPRLLITGGVHGDEFEPMEAIRRLRSRVSPAMLRGRLTLAPVVNEAAWWRGHRVAAEDGLDLARICPGKPDGSMTERTGHALATLIHDANAYIDLHTGGTELLIHPLCGYGLHPDRGILDTQRRMATAFNVDLIWGTSAKLNGRSLSVARDARVPAIYAEWGGGARCDPAGVDSYVDGCLNVMAALDMLDRPTPASRVRHVIEDTGDASGHLQVQHPAPIAGYYRTIAHIGDVVKTGQTIGECVDLLGDETHAVPASHDGVLIVQRTFPRVNKGDTCAAIAAFASAGDHA